MKLINRMKPHIYNNKFTSISVLICLLLTTLFFVSCDKKESNDVNDSNKSGAVSISVNSIKEPMLLTSAIGDGQSKKASIQKTSAVIGSTSGTEQDFENFSWSLSPEVTSQPTNSASLNSSGSVKKAAAQFVAGVTSMATGKKYRILFYEVQGANQIYRASEEISVSGSRYTLNLASNVTYHWYAYSYNDGNAIPLPSDVNNPVIATRTDAPFLYDEGQITTNATTESMVDIQFEHKISKIEVKVDALQVFANSITSIQANFVNLPLTTQGFGLKTGTLNSPVLSTVNYNNAVTFVNEASPAVKISTNVLYTSTALTSFQVNFTELTINKSGSTVNLINASNPKAAVIGNFSTSPESLRRGLVTLKYKGGVIGNTEWAQGLLYYDPTDPTNPYKISEPFLTATIHSCNYYWNFNSIYPRSITNQSLAYPGDPCSKVLPEGTWKTPTVQDFNDLGQGHNSSPGVCYFNAADGERVYFHENGHIINPGCNVTNTDDGKYWSSESINTNHGSGFEIDESGFYQIESEIKDFAKGIRCIKNN
ncbi:hypothetical protein LZQ00_06360 [Sphingobacterium sp. SRCM116780]|uniref:hypothetical protein n=1 Tax=Sphingobacterium sp. SRCM116780 TaxID=2907623 RepID=UPI001F1D8572|nr:hypothetical protein [Sphingobacterium sp. SRCM116780]UIR57437.1 hypothetical protein LZQ00_06360 [Sphingobacterium sp. SRCM116780]